MTGQNISDRKPLKVGLIGAGRIVERAHLPALRQSPGVFVTGVFDPDEDRARELATQFQIPNICGSLKDLFKLEPDVTLVACPNNLHAEMAMAALEAGSHVLCEKPMAVSAAEAEAMLEKSKAAGRELMAVSANRFRPEFQALRQAVTEGTLGEITSVRCGWLRNRGIPGLNSWFTNRRLAGGGVLIDLGSHLIDLAIALIGLRKPLSISCHVDRAMVDCAQSSWYRPAERKSDEADARGCDVETSASGYVVFEGPLSLFVDLSWDCALPQDRTYIHCIGRDGIAQIETLFGFSPNGLRPECPLSIWKDGRLVAQPAIGVQDLLQPYRGQWEFFIDHLNQGHSLQQTARDSAKMVQIIEGMYKAAEPIGQNIQ
jgi:predicted dehydrogenase